MIKFKHIYKSYGKLSVLEDFSLTFEEKKVSVLLGPSGCGKTTLLKIASNLESVDKGILVSEDNPAMIFQEPRLIPWRSIHDNLKLVIDKKYSNEQKDHRIKTILEELELVDVSDKWPSQLSGGMQQRVSLARAFLFRSNTLFMDEPYKGLDLQLKYKMINMLKRMLFIEPKTVIFVTHDVDEAILLGDTISILSSIPTKIVNIFENKLSEEERIPSSNSFSTFQNKIVLELLSKKNNLQ